LTVGAIASGRDVARGGKREQKQGRIEQGERDENRGIMPIACLGAEKLIKREKNENALCGIAGNSDPASMEETMNQDHVIAHGLQQK